MRICSFNQLLLIVFSTILVFTSCINQNEEEKLKAYSVLSYEDYAEEIEKNEVVLIDVRSSGEYKNGHIPGAIQANIESKEFEDKIAALNINKNEPVYIYCLSGNRSKKAASKMQEMGFENIIDLDGGIRAWRGDIQQ